MTEFTVQYKDQKVPKWITKGNHARFIAPVIEEFLFEEEHMLEMTEGGVNSYFGYDIGYKNHDWILGGANSGGVNIPCRVCGVDEEDHDDYLPSGKPLDFIFSSHCLEHISDWVSELEMWCDCLRPGGRIMLYLPHRECVYWRPWEMPTKRHVNCLHPEDVQETLESCGIENVFVSGMDLAYSFCVLGEKTSE